MATNQINAGTKAEREIEFRCDDRVGGVEAPRRRRSLAMRRRRRPVRWPRLATRWTRRRRRALPCEPIHTGPAGRKKRIGHFS